MWALIKFLLNIAALIVYIIFVITTKDLQECMHVSIIIIVGSFLGNRLLDLFKPTPRITFGKIEINDDENKD